VNSSKGNAIDKESAKLMFEITYHTIVGEKVRIMKRQAQLANKHKSSAVKSKRPKSRVAAANLGSRKLAGTKKSKSKIKSLQKLTPRKSAILERSSTPRVVRIMGRGQFKVNSRILKRLNQVDAIMVTMASKEKADDAEFKRKLVELSEIVIKDGKPVPTKEMVKSDIILPSADLPVDEAKKLFTVQGVIPQF
jgi:phage shock protein A